MKLAGVETMETISFDGKFLHVGDRIYRNVKPTEPFNDSDLSTGRKYRQRRVRVLFESGWQLSVVWGTGTYSSNYHATEWKEEPTMVEVAVLNGHDEFVGDDVHAWVEADELIGLIEYAKTWPSDPTFVPTEGWRHKVEAE